MSHSKYLASGQYGCVVKPAYHCDIKKELLIDNTIAKIFEDKNNYKLELKRHHQISKIDKNNDFTIKMISNCEIDLSFINSHVKDMSDCDLIIDANKIYQIIYEDGGEDLEVFFYNLKSNFDAYEFFKKFIQLFNGIKLLIKNNLSHSDIKLTNILFNGDKLILIDFGLLLNFNDIFKTHITNLKYRTLLHYPNDLKLYLLKDSKNKNYNYNLNSNDLLDNLKNYLTNAYDPNYDIYFKHLMKLYNFIITENNIYCEKFNKKDYRRNANKIFGEKLDIYQLGIVLIEVIFLIIVSDYAKEILKIPIEIFEIITQMLEPDVIKRIDIDTLIKKYSLLFNK